MLALLLAAPAARGRPDRPLPATRSGRDADLRGLGARPVHGRARRALVGHLAPAARPRAPLRLRPRARLKPACVQVFRPNGHAGVRARERHAGARGARRLQGLRRQRGPQGPRLDDGAPPGIRLAAAWSVRFHSLETWLFRERGRRCWRERARWRTSARRWRTARASRAATPGACCPPGCRSAYEEWATALDVGGVLARARPSASTTRSPSSTRPIRSAWSSTSAGLRAARPGRLGLALQGRPPDRAPPALVPAQRRPLPLPHRRLRPPRAAGLLQIVSRRIRVDQRRERDGVENAFIMEQPSRRRHLPRRPRLPPAQGLRVPGLLRSAHQLT